MRILIAALLVGSLACASRSGTGGPPATSAPAPAAGLRLPPTIAGFNLTSRRNFDDPRAGSVFRYIGPDSLYADVFLYPGPDLATNCNAQCATRAMQQEVGQFEHSDLPAMVQQNSIESFSISIRETLPTPGDSLWHLGAHVRATLQRMGRPERSEYFLYYLPRLRVKMRITYLESDSRTQAVDGFVQALMPSLMAPRT